MRPSSPAASAGLKVGDVFTAIDGAAIADADQLTSVVSAHQPGDKLVLIGWERDGQVCCITMVKADSLAGEPILARMTKAPANDAPIGGLKVVTENGWFAARPSGTEDVYKLYAESFKGRDHLGRIQDEARAIVAAALLP